MGKGGNWVVDFTIEDRVLSRKSRDEDPKVVVGKTTFLLTRQDQQFIKQVVETDKHLYI